MFHQQLLNSTLVAVHNKSNTPKINQTIHHLSKFMIQEMKENLMIQLVNITQLIPYLEHPLNATAAQRIDELVKNITSRGIEETVIVDYFFINHKMNIFFFNYQHSLLQLHQCCSNYSTFL